MADLVNLFKNFLLQTHQSGSSDLGVYGAKPPPFPPNYEHQNCSQIRTMAGQNELEQVGVEIMVGLEEPDAQDTTMQVDHPPQPNLEVLLGVAGRRSGRSGRTKGEGDDRVRTESRHRVEGDMSSVL